MGKQDLDSWNDYPALFRASEQAAQRYEKLLLVTQSIQLGSLVLGSLASSVVLMAPDGLEPWLYVTTAVCLFAGLLFTWVARAMNYESMWFDCRAVAESVKTATWRFVVCALPFDGSQHDRTIFITKLREIRKARPEAAPKLAGKLEAAVGEITAGMEEIRPLPAPERLRFYLHERAHNQRVWYTSKANQHANSATWWFWGVLILQALAVYAAVIVAVFGPLRVDIVVILVTLAAIGIAWDQSRRNTELARTYSLAAQELSALESLAPQTDIEKRFSQYVDQVEDAISREHTLWCARRDIPLA